MMLGYVTDLARGRARPIGNQMGFDQGFRAQPRGEHVAGVVLADHTDKNAAGAERGDVARHVAGAAGDEVAPGHRQDRSRRFRRDARHLAIDELVEHQVSHAEQGLPGHEIERGFEVEHELSPDDCRGSAAVQRYRSG